MKRLIAAILALIMAFPACAVFATDKTDVEDTSMSYTEFTQKNGIVYDVADGANPVGRPFNYTIPEGGAAVIVFFNAAGWCRNSNEMISSLSSTLWAKDDRINLIAVESYAQSRTKTANFIDTYDQIGRAHV